MLTGKCAVVGVSGGIAAYKACDIVRKLKQLHCNVRVVMTAHAKEFVSPLTFETLSGNQVYSDNFERAWEIGHISLAKSADIMILAPATANMIGKIACGIADDLMSTAVMAMPAPILIAPAMNSVMWRSAANQANVETLKARGFSFVGPESGELACGDSDVGRMSQPQEIVEAACKILLPRRDLQGLTVLVTAGPTREMLDPVRFLTNRSTGRMGYAVAEAAQARGARVELVSGPVELTAPRGVRVTNVTSTMDMYQAVTEIARRADIVIQSAAPADFTPETVAEQKIKKNGDTLTLTLKSTPDIAMRLGSEKRPGQVLVAFAAETEHALSNAAGKRARKNADFIVVNDVTRPGAGFGTDTNIVSLVCEEGVKDYPILSKRQVADIILDEAARLIACATRK